MKLLISTTLTGGGGGGGSPGIGGIGVPNNVMFIPAAKAASTAANSVELRFCAKQSSHGSTSIVKLFIILQVCDVPVAISPVAEVELKPV